MTGKEKDMATIKEAMAEARDALQELACAATAMAGWCQGRINAEADEPPEEDLLPEDAADEVKVAINFYEVDLSQMDDYQEGDDAWEGNEDMDLEEDDEDAEDDPDLRDADWTGLDLLINGWDGKCPEDDSPEDDTPPDDVPSDAGEDDCHGDSDADLLARYIHELWEARYRAEKPETIYKLSEAAMHLLE